MKNCAKYQSAIKIRDVAGTPNVNTIQIQKTDHGKVTQKRWYFHFISTEIMKIFSNFAKFLNHFVLVTN